MKESMKAFLVVIVVLLLSFAAFGLLWEEAEEQNQATDKTTDKTLRSTYRIISDGHGDYYMQRRWTAWADGDEIWGSQFPCKDPSDCECDIRYWIDAAKLAKTITVIEEQKDVVCP